MATAQAVSPSSDGTCILKPSSGTDPFPDIERSVKSTKDMLTSFKSDSEIVTAKAGHHSRQQLNRQVNRANKRRRGNSISDNFSTGTSSHQNVKRRKGPGHHKRNASSGRIILPTNFLHGGNITDPLNLNSMMDENINRALNAVTPSSSPLPPRNSVIDIVTPADITDPLGLNDFAQPSALNPASKITKIKSRRSKRKKNHMYKSQDHHSATDVTTNSDDPTETSPVKHRDRTDLTSRKNGRNKRPRQSPVQLVIPLSATQTHVRDPIVSPAIPQDTGRTKSHTNTKYRRRKHGGKRSTIDAGIQTDSTDQVDVKLRCGSEKTCHGSHFSPVKRRRTHSENLSISPWPDKDGRGKFFSGFFGDGAANSSQDSEKEHQNILVKPIGSRVSNDHEDCSHSPAQRYMNSEEMSSQKPVTNDVKQKVHVDVKPKRQAIVLPVQAMERETASSSHHVTNRMESNKPYNAQYQYGNYTRYYGYRNDEKFKDVRMECLKKEWFRDKDVLDVGCNSGHLTLLIARDYQPRKIVGIDIDDSLIRVARNNIRHYASNSKSGRSGSKFPASMAITMGPLATPPVETGKDDATAAFPNNVNFFQGNYVPKKDEILLFQEPEYDVILCMSVTKWIHLNWGDEGLMRLFQRAFKQLRAGGMFILEPQPWSSYVAKRRMCEQLNENFKTLQMRPDSFPTMLIEEIGFAKVEHVKTVEKNSTRGFKRPIQVYYKPE